jgi:hypothetical protein
MAKKWLFTTLLAGEYHISLPDGELESHTGLDMFLGVGTGDTPDEAFSGIFNKLGLDKLHLENATIYAHEVVDSRKVHRVNFSKAKHIIVFDGKKAIYDDNKKACEWCGKELPTNGAAQFSHIKMHFRQLVNKGKLTPEQANVRSVELSPELRKIFEEHFKKGKK